MTIKEELIRLLKLVDDYGKACGRADVSNSGLCIDSSASSQWKTMQELRRQLKEGFTKLIEENNNGKTNR